MKEGTRTMIDRVVLYGLSCLNLSGMNYLFLEILYLENSLYSNNFIKKTPEELSIVRLNWTRFIFWHIGLPINCPGKLRGTIRTRLSLLTDAYLFLHNCATLTSLPRQSIWNATFVLRSEDISVRLNRCASTWYLISSLNRCRPLWYSEKEAGNSRREDRGTGYCCYSRKGGGTSLVRGASYQKLKFHSARPEASLSRSSRRFRARGNESSGSGEGEGEGEVKV